MITAAALPPECTAVLGDTHAQRITTMVSDLVAHSQGRPSIEMGEVVAKATNGLKDFLYERFYEPLSIGDGESGRVARAIGSLFRFYMEHPAEFAGGMQAAARGTKGLARAVCDHVAGMTDRFAGEQLIMHFLPRPWRGTP
jgi:dGTPase